MADQFSLCLLSSALRASLLLDISHSGRPCLRDAQGHTEAVNSGLQSCPTAGTGENPKGEVAREMFFLSRMLHSRKD